MPHYKHTKLKTIKYKEAPSGYINIGKWVPPFKEVKGGHGFVGVVAEDTKTGQLQCHHCGKWYQQLQTHMIKHKLNGESYRAKYGLLSSTALKSKRIRLIHSKTCRASIKAGKMNKGNIGGYGFKKGVYQGCGFKKGNKLSLGKNNGMWKGGISNNPYPKAFNAELKLKIRQRDNFTCCLCGKTEREELEELNRVLCVNHIDFNKNNCKKNNLNTLCLRCNVKINREREYWTEYFKIYE